MGTTALSGGGAVLTISALALGGHSIHAIRGDPLTPGARPRHPQTVDAITTATTVTSRH